MMVRRLCAVVVALILLVGARSASAAVAVDATTFKDLGTASTTIVTPPFSTTSGNELLLAFVSTDFLGGTNTTVQTVTGAGLTWALVVRTNVQSGTSEIWRAFAPAPLTNVTVTATTSQSVISQMTVMSFSGVDPSGTNGSGAIGAVASANASGGAPAATLTTTRNGSWIVGVGNDYDNAVTRTPATGQSVVHQYLPSIGDSYWVQKQNAPTPAAGTSVTINDSAPTGDRYNLSICEILAAPAATIFTLSGTISPAQAGSGATVTLAGALLTAVADASGNYTITGVPNGTYTVTPRKNGLSFTPVNQSATVNGANLSGVNFTAVAAPTHSVSGAIAPALAGLGTTVTLSGLAGAVGVADASGNYTITGVPDGSYTATPSRSGYSFLPANRAVTVSGATVSGIDFAAHALTGSISGTVTPVTLSAGATIILGETAQATVDGNGHYVLANVPNGTYSVVGFKNGFTFTPTSRAATVNGDAVTGIDFALVSIADPSLVGQWSAPFDVGLVAVNMVMLHTGKVLMFSGAYATNGVERVWDPSTGTATLVPNPYYNLFCAGQSQLADGRILVVGGYDSNSLGAANANIFDPVGQSWSALPNMAYRRWYPTSTTLPDGRALITSGAQTCMTCLADVPEIFDPATGRFTKVTTARLAVPYYPFMFVLPDGTVADAGANEDAVATSKFDPATNAWTTVDPVVRDGHSAAMYLPGKILKSGTATDSGAVGNAAATAFVIDMTQPTPAWRQIGPMAFPRAFQNTTLLPDGTAVVTGGGTSLDGYDVNKAVKAAELWSPLTETWRTLASAAIPRLYHSTALLLPDGRVLTAGSGNDGPAVNQTEAELFSPPYLFKGARPTIASAPQTAQYGSTMTVQTPDAASIASVSLVRPGAVTHGFDEDQRFLSLAFSAAAGVLTVQTPANANLAPPGYYMLFLVNTAGAPSIASFVQFAPAAGDFEAPSAPFGLGGEGSVGAATLTWAASTDNTGVALYNIHSAVTSGFQPSAANRIGQATSTAFTHAGAAAGMHYYIVTAQDVSGNVSGPSNEAAVLVTADTTPPAVAFTSPAPQSTVSGSISVSANAADDVGIAGVQFQLDGNALGAERSAAPYAMTWSTTGTANGSHTLTAVARDAAGNKTLASVDVVVSNTAQAPGGLVAAYGFNETSGVQVVDASSQGNTGTISSATRSANGKYGGALSFNGTNAWVTVPDAPSLDLTTGMTLEAWVNPTSGSAWRTVVLKESSGGLAYSLYSANGASRPAGFVHVSSDVGLNGTTAVPLNAWTHVAVTYDGTTLRMFVNGAQVSSLAQAGAAAVSSGALRIGGNSVWGEYFKGLVDEVRIYNRALTATEIQTDMNTPIP